MTLLAITRCAKLYLITFTDSIAHSDAPFLPQRFVALGEGKKKKSIILYGGGSHLHSKTPHTQNSFGATLVAGFRQNPIVTNGVTL